MKRGEGGQGPTELEPTSVEGRRDTLEDVGPSEERKEANVAQPKLSLWGRGALHRQVVYEPNMQEETLTAEAADSPDFTLYS